MRNDYSSTSADRQSDAAGSLTKFILERHSKHQQQLRAFGISISAGCEVPKQNLKHQRLLKIIICMKVHDDSSPTGDATPVESSARTAKVL